MSPVEMPGACSPPRQVLASALFPVAPAVARPVSCDSSAVAFSPPRAMATEPRPYFSSRVLQLGLSQADSDMMKDAG
eukprot:14933271-Alexandrium_andersonii.AAC.1